MIFFFVSCVDENDNRFLSNNQLRLSMHYMLYNNKLWIKFHNINIIDSVTIAM